MKAAERNRKKIYRVMTGGKVFSEHKTYDLALRSEKKADEYAARSVVGLKPETMIHIERWSAKYGTWERVSS